jgi:hypothetical protein
MATKKRNIINAIRMLNTQKSFSQDELSSIIPILVLMAEKYNWNTFGLLKKYGNNWKEISLGLGKLLFQGDKEAENDLRTLHGEYFTIRGMSSGLLIGLDEFTKDLEQEDIERVCH